MSSWRHPAYLIPVLIAVALVFIIQMNSDYVTRFVKKIGQGEITGKNIFYGSGLNGLVGRRDNGELGPPEKAQADCGPAFKKPGRVCLSLMTFPPDACIMIDRRARGRSPLNLRGLAPGRHLVEIDKPGYTLQRVPIDLAADENISIKLRRETRPRLIRFAQGQGMRGAAAPAESSLRLDLASLLSADSERAERDIDHVAGLIRDPLGTEKVARSSWSLF